MSDERIPPDSTILTIQGQLDDPIPYVRRVLENLLGIGPDARVRIAVNAGAGAPDYMIEDVVNPDGQTVPTMGYTGKTNRRLAFKRSLVAGDWSNASVGIHEVRELLGGLRNFKPKGGLGAKRT